MLKFPKRLLALALMAFLWIVACSPQSTTTSSEPLRFGIGLWTGYAGGYVALNKNFFTEEGVKIEETAFQNLSDGITAFLAKKTDVLWATSADAVQMSTEEPSLRVIYLSDYSNGGDGIVGRNINSPTDLKGKTIARENLLFENVFLRAYLEQGNLTEQDVVLRDMAAPDASSAFAAKKVDAVVSYEPWMTKAAQEGGGKILFTSKDTNLLADVIVVRKQLIDERKADLQALLKAIDKGTKLVTSGDEEALKIVADKLGATPAEAKEQLNGVKFFDIESNKAIAFDPNSPASLIKNLEFTAKVAYDLKIIPKPLETTSLYDDSIVKSL